MHRPTTTTTPARPSLGALLHDPRVIRASIWAVVLLALAVRLYRAWRFNEHHVDGPERLVYGDEPSYNGVALDLLHGRGFPGVARVPLYPAWIALLHGVSGEDYDLIPYAQALLGTLTVFLAYLLGRRLVGHWPAVAASLYAAVSLVLVRQSLHVLSEVLFTPALLMVALTLQRAMERPSPRRWAWAGLWVGVADLVRPTLLFFPAFVAVAALLLWGVRTGGRRAVVYAGTAALVIAPWTLRNYVSHDVFLPLATSNAALWLGSPEYFHLVRDQGYTYHRVWDEVIYPDDPSVPYPGTVEGDRYWSARALRSIRAEPLVYLRFAAEKSVTYWIGDPNADWGDSHVFDYGALRAWGYRHRDAIRLMMERALIVLALGAAVVLRRRWRALLPVYLLLAYCVALHAATVARARMSEPLQPFLLILIAGAAAQLVGARLGARAGAERREAAGPGDATGAGAVA